MSDATPLVFEKGEHKLVFQHLPTGAVAVDFHYKNVVGNKDVQCTHMTPDEQRRLIKFLEADLKRQGERDYMARLRKQYAGYSCATQ